MWVAPKVESRAAKMAVAKADTMGVMKVDVMADVKAAL